MSRDLRTKQNDYFDRNKMYKRIVKENGKIERNPVSFGIFYSKDKIAMSTTKQQLSNDTQYLKDQVTITTRDYLGDLKPNDYVEYGGEIYRVESIIADDTNKAKGLQKRPDFESEIVLTKIVEN